MIDQNNEVRSSNDQAERSEWERPEFRRIEADNAEAVSGFSAVDLGTFDS